ncbi:MAG: trypsin-like peptidase domain-containing protein [Deltaproteobacteria bacterium]|nr:trypsin-like peptidase domain-containing protein [Deltaproteobacteria bacterium]
MDTPGPKIDSRGIKRKPAPRVGRYARTFFLAAIVASIAVMAVVLVMSVVRDRKELSASPRETIAGKEIGNRGPAADAGREPAPESPPLPGGIAATAAPPESVNNSEAVFRKASPSVVTVKIFTGDDKQLTKMGSGVVFGPGTVATNRHVVESGGVIRVTDQGREYAATVLYADREYDLCALSVPGLAAPAVELASFRTIRTGQRVYAIGAPRGLELSISDGLVSGIRSYGEFPLIQTNAPISKGSSGGGLFDTEGRLVGITTASVIDGQNINFALVSDLIPQLPTRSADIRTLNPIVPVKSADEINNKALLASLQEVKQSIASIEAELRARADEINRNALPFNELKQSMNGFIAAGNAKAYNDLVPQYNQMNAERNELLNRFEQKRQEHAALMEKHNQLAEQLHARGRPQP